MNATLPSMSVRRSGRTRNAHAVGMVVAILTGYAAVVVAAADGSEPGYSTAQAVRGEALYREHCVKCHGARLEGAPGAPLTGEAFRGRWEDGQHSVDDLLYVVRTQMPYDAPGSLARRDYVDVVTYILQVNGYPAGDGELSGDAAVLGKFVMRPH